MDVARASQPGRPAGPQAAVPHEGAACLGRPGACRGESGGVLLCRHRVGGGRVTRVARPPSSALRGFSTLRTVSCLSLRTHVAVAGGNPACEPRLPSSGQASPAPGAEGKAGGRVAGGARATGTAGRHPGPRNRGRAGGAARGLGARSRTGGTPGCGHAAPAPPRPRPAPPTAQRHPGARGDLHPGVRGAPGPLCQQPWRLRPQQVAWPAGWPAGAPAGTADSRPCCPQGRLPGLPLPEAAAAHRPQGLPGAAAAAQPPADALSGARPGRGPGRAPASAPHRRGPRRRAHPAAPSPGEAPGRGVGAGWARAVAAPPAALGGWSRQRWASSGPPSAPMPLPLTGASPAGHGGLHHPRARAGPLRLPAPRLPAGPPHLRRGGPRQRRPHLAG